VILRFGDFEICFDVERSVNHKVPQSAIKKMILKFEDFEIERF